MSWLTSWSLPGGLTGLILGLGGWLIIVGLPVNRRPELAERMAPYLRDALPPSRLLGSQPDASKGLALLLRPLVRDLAVWVDRVMGGSASVRRRLLRAGRGLDVDGFRSEQVLWGAAGGGIGLILGLLAIVGREASAVAVVVLVGCCVLTGVMARDQWLSREVRLREERIMAEFPTVAELLALAVSAGEGAAGALDRVCRLSRGELSVELGRCLADARAGASLPSALQGLADRTGLVSLARFVDGMIVAVERGSPLAEVLRAQAQDAREAGRRAVMESGGRKEIGMLVPIVFLVLPITIVFAIFPGIAMLRLDM
ncbi:MAG: pilus assembly protein TadB [Actinomycetales bacterium]|nr:MAG: pilus assembly protein TadB [Actinomycetales bacterium]